MPRENRITFNKRALEALAPSAKRTFYRDARTRGLTLRVEPTGQKAFYLYRKVNGKPVMHKLGNFPEMTVEQARARIDEISVAIAQHGEVQAAIRTRHVEPTFRELFAWYLAEHSKKHKRSWAQDEERFRNHLQGLADRPLWRVGQADVRQLHSRLGEEVGRYAANKVLFLLRAVYNQAIAAERWKGPNPALGIKPYREDSRDRRLGVGEMPTFLQAVYDEPSADVRDFVLLALFTGARKANVLAMRWEQVDRASQTWRIPVTKNGTPQTVPLNALALEILEARGTLANVSPWVFPGPGAAGHMQDPRKGWMRILARAGIADLRIHDLRRTLGSWMVDTGASLPVIGKALHHKSQETTAVYARLALDPVRLAMDKAIGQMVAAATHQAEDAPPG